MKLGILLFILMYYGAITIVFFGMPSIISAGASSNVNMTTMSNATLSSGESVGGGLFAAAVDFVRFFGFVAFGVGLSPSVPFFAAFIFAVWESCVTIYTVGFIVDSIWSG